MLPSMAVAQPLAPLMTAPEELREKFGAAVSGEFTGYEADFDADSGAALVVPNYYIPEEFSEMSVHRRAHSDLPALRFSNRLKTTG
jgi:hypothetical protein